MSSHPKRHESSYLTNPFGPVKYVPVVLQDTIVGYLYASDPEGAAGFIRRLEEKDRAFRAPLVWARRLREACTAGLAPTEALEKWRGASEDPEGGAIPADAPVGEAEDEDALTELANPGYVNPSKDVFAREPTWPDGTPMDRRKVRETLGPIKTPETDYRASTDQAVRYLPVVRQGRVVGYLWASVTDDAAHWQNRGDAGALGKDAGVPWVLRLREAAEQGLTPLQALRHWKDAPDDPRGGVIPAGAEEGEAPSLRALRALTNNYATSTDQAVEYFPIVRQRRTVGYLWVSVADDAGSFLARPDAGPDGENARLVWEQRFHDAVKEALSPMDAVRKWWDAPEDPLGGAIKKGPEKRTAPNLQVLNDIANE